MESFKKRSNPQLSFHFFRLLLGKFSFSGVLFVAVALITLTQVWALPEEKNPLTVSFSTEKISHSQADVVATNLKKQMTPLKHKVKTVRLTLLNEPLPTVDRTKDIPEITPPESNGTGEKKAEINALKKSMRTHKERVSPSEEKANLQESPMTNRLLEDADSALKDLKSGSKHEMRGGEKKGQPGKKGHLGTGAGGNGKGQGKGTEGKNGAMGSHKQDGNTDGEQSGKLKKGQLRKKSSPGMGKGKIRGGVKKKMGH